MKAVWNGATLAESDKTSDTHTTCHWKGEASYYTVGVDGKTNADAAWFYPDPKPEAAEIKDYVAFWHGVKVES
jgi:uncharacterized protein (DUF427 family)